MIKVIKHENMGRSDRGWLHSLFHFSFAEYYKPDNIKFGALRVVQFYKPAFMRGISDPLFSMIPFLVTAIVLVITSIRLRPERMQPKGCGTNYDREER